MQQKSFFVVFNRGNILNGLEVKKISQKNLQTILVILLIVFINIYEVDISIKTTVPTMELSVSDKINFPIHIDGNDDFYAQATANGLPGTGTPSAPYIIDGYE